tara:strand:- start:277 stop:651 length:375 start_codon:yes stop_codon:yes gene_type:complete
MTKPTEQLVTVICLRTEPRYEEVVMTLSEFKAFNKEFKETELHELTEDFIERYKFEDWQWGAFYIDETDLPTFKFRAYPGDITSESDDIVSADTDQSWQESFLNKPLIIRKHANYFKYIKESNR